jgi:hypothetical protein
MPDTLREADLAGPLVAWLTAEGWTVRSEVKDCDIAAVRGEDLLVVEIKKAMSLALLAQAARRQKITDTVYVAIPRPANKWKWWKESRGVQHLLRRLELGLLLVSPGQDASGVDVVFDPRPFTRRSRSKSRTAVLEEIAHRTADYNNAGTTRTPLVTAYRENAIHVACCLLKKGDLAPAGLRALGTGAKTYSILRSNVYGWFARGEDGSYSLTARGREELAGYPALKARYWSMVGTAKGEKRAEGGAGGLRSHGPSAARSRTTGGKKKKGT